MATKLANRANLRSSTPAEQGLDRQEGAVGLLVQVCEAGAVAAREGSAAVRALLVDGAGEAPRHGIDHERGAAPVVDLHVAAVLDEVGERARRVPIPAPAWAQ